MDADGERYGVRGYKLYGAELGTSAPDSKFALHLVDHPDGSRDVKLVLLREVDYEEQDSYTLVFSYIWLAIQKVASRLSLLDILYTMVILNIKNYITYSRSLTC